MAELTETTRAPSGDAPSGDAPRDDAALRRAALQSWRVGAVTVTKIVELVTQAPIDHVFNKGTTEELLAIPWLQPDHVTLEGLIIMSMHALIVDTPTRRIMVDTCIGNDKARAMEIMNHLQTPFLTDLEAAGFARDSFDMVLCTHLHVDHVGWNTMLVDGKWVPTFPKARYLIEKREYDYWAKGEDLYAENGWDVIQNQCFADSIQPIVDAGLVDLVDGSHPVCDEVDLVPTIGHSPGHVCVRIRSQGEEALITGDMTHHPSQLVHLDWGMGLDFDSAQAIRTRAEVFADVADRDVLMIGTHWAGEGTVSRIMRDGDVFRLKP